MLLCSRALTIAAREDVQDRLLGLLRRLQNLQLVAVNVAFDGVCDQLAEYGGLDGVYFNARSFEVLCSGVAAFWSGESPDRARESGFLSPRGG